MNGYPRFKMDKRGATLTGYGLVVGLISIVALAAVTNTGDEVEQLFCTTSDALASASGGPLDCRASGAAGSGAGAGAAAPADTTPDAFVLPPVSYTESTGQTIQSEIAEVSGLDEPAPLTFSRSSSGNGEYRICADAFCSSVLQNWGSDDSGVTVSAGQYVQTRLTTGGGTRTATVNIGGVEATQTYQFGEGNIVYQHVSSGQYYGIFKVNFSYRIMRYSDVQNTCSSFGRQAPDDPVSSGTDMLHVAGFTGWPGATIYCYQDAINSAGNYTACRPFLLNNVTGGGVRVLTYTDNQIYASQSNYLFCKIDDPNP
ncbi:MAG: hypothetical protein Alpg2KO_29770 [Alphaproteobacteria bacterium]